MRQTTRLKQIAARRDGVSIPGTPNAMFARIIEMLGFEAIYVTGAGVANMNNGLPDIGLTTAGEIAEVVAAVSDVVDLPVIADIDTGFGNALNVVRTIRTFERAGAAGAQMEDQIFPKRCGHFGGKSVVPLDQMLQKIRAAADTRSDPDFQIIARTDMRAIEGLSAAIERAHAFIEAGADLTFVEAPESLEELNRIGQELPVPQVANIVFGGKTPDPGREGLRAAGFSLVLYANAALQAAAKGAFDVLGALREDGSLAGVSDKLVSFEERQRIIDKGTWDELEEKYRS